MAQKLLKHELVERLLKLKEKQDELTVQMQCLSQEINALAQPYMPKEPKPQPLITMQLVAQVLRENPDWMFCGEIADRILVKLRKRGIVESGLKFWRLKLLK